MAILFVDVLGVRSRWKSGGRNAVLALCARFETLVRSSMACAEREFVVEGIIESDSVAIRFTTAESAVRVAKRLYRRAFLTPTRHLIASGPDRLWLRGAILDDSGTSTLRQTQPISETFPRIYRTTYSDALLDAVSVEKSGFKGMRCLIQSSLVNEQLRNKFAIGQVSPKFRPFQRLRYSTYPSDTAGPFHDFLWMATSSEEYERNFGKHMAARLRLAASVPEEFLHAAATQVVFHECGGLVETFLLMNARRSRRSTTR